MNKIEKMASKDAHEWARAEMFFGDGAGIRRRHLDAEINEKMSTLPGYIEAFNSWYDKQDMTKHAEAALRERKNLDRAAKAGKNFRALKSGNITGLSNGVFLVVGAAYLAHATGYDEKIKVEAQRLYRKTKAEVKARKARMTGGNVTNFYFNPGVEDES